MAGDPTSIRNQGELRPLLEEVFRTRAARVEGQKQKGATPQSLLPVRRAALRALEDYDLALRRHGWPTPPAMHRDIELLRALCGTRRSPR
jgi:hypothetical protein